MARLALAFNAESRVGFGRGGGRAGRRGPIAARLPLRRLWALRVGGGMGSHHLALCLFSATY